MFSNSWLFPIVESMHVAGMALLAGTITLLDIRLLGVGFGRMPLPRLEQRVTRWKRAGLAMVLLTGPLLFAADTGRYLRNPAFLVKMAVLALALLFHFKLRRTRRTAAVSLVLWTCVVLAARAIADFDIY